MGTISFNNNGLNIDIKNKVFLKIFLASIFKEEGYEFELVSYIFSTDEYLLKLNKKYLNHDTLTDIITFNLSDPSLPIVSDIYISIERVKENAQELQIEFSNELNRVMIHGILHLCGYSDHNTELKFEMRKKEDQYLSKMIN
ncbi:MAG: rRNA maturation RNase YbeY [Bacteroidota bacterium]|nr:rRNA maturation RNase YbeY [Bacteroidota bacterium]